MSIFDKDNLIKINPVSLDKDGWRHNIPISCRFWFDNKSCYIDGIYTKNLEYPFYINLYHILIDINKSKYIIEVRSNTDFNYVKRYYESPIFIDDIYLIIDTCKAEIL